MNALVNFTFQNRTPTPTKSIHTSEQSHQDEIHHASL